MFVEEVLMTSHPRFQSSKLPLFLALVIVFISFFSLSTSFAQSRKGRPSRSSLKSVQVRPFALQYPLEQSGIDPNKRSFFFHVEERVSGPQSRWSCVGQIHFFPPQRSWAHYSARLVSWGHCNDANQTNSRELEVYDVLVDPAASDQNASVRAYRLYRSGGEAPFIVLRHREDPRSPNLYSYQFMDEANDDGIVEYRSHLHEQKRR